MLFGLFNACSTFMRLMNYILKPFTNNFMVVYFDYILTNNKCKEQHLEHVKAVQIKEE